jgi:hypothetical protein
MSVPNANMVTSSFDRINGNPSNPRNQPINNFRITNSGGNIIQGQMNKISVTELMMPYNVPTVGQLNQVVVANVYTVPVSGNPSLYFTSLFGVPLGYYTGQELADAINIADFDNGQPVLNYFQVIWNADSQTLTLGQGTSWSSVSGGYAVEFLILDIDYPMEAEQNRNVFSYPHLLFTAGFRNFFAANRVSSTIPSCHSQFAYPAIFPAGTPPAVLAAWPTPAFEQIKSSQYSGRYTDYIDIVSTSLAQAQYIRDSNTNQSIPKRDVIARVYVCTNVSTYTTDAAGTRPFTIWRNWTCPKVLKWTADRSIDAIDLSLFDMYGQPLPISSYGITPGAVDFDCGPSDYAITFHVHEPGADVQSENVGYKY